MSMLSSQVEELRNAATTYRMLGRHTLANVLLEAAESITELRDHLQRANDENAKLRELGGEVASILFNLDVDRCGLCDRDSVNHPCPVHTVKGGECLIKSELRELGIEVPDGEV